MLRGFELHGRAAPRPAAPSASKPGEEVITVSHSFIATANAIRYCGAMPVFVDIRLDDLNMDPALIEAAITPGDPAPSCASTSWACR